MVERVSWIPPRAMSTRAGTAPAVLRFATDDFMTELVDALGAPDGLDDVLAEPETWRTSMAPTFPTAPPSTDTSSVTKLYQPVHGRFYLVAAHLVCRRVGEPDRRLDREESVGFVVRRLAAGQEYAWVSRPDAARWSRVTDEFVVEPGEEVLPMAPTAHRHRGRSSRLYTGLVPVGARERYERRSATDATEPEGDEPTALAIAVVDTVVAPLAELAVDFADAVDTRADAIELALLDLVDWLDLTGVSMPGSLDEATVDPAGADAVAIGDFTWRDLIDEIRLHRADVLAGDHSSRARLVSSRSAVARFLGIAAPAVPDPGEPSVRIDAAATPLARALVGALETASPPIIDAELPDDAPPPPGGDDVLYVFRTVYRNDVCARPHAAWVSQPTEPFRFAAFFDPDAPARPVQIALPIDTSPRGLRQFPRNVSVLLSSQLRRQMSQINDEFEKTDGGDFGLGKLCTLSIPIITICALILLMIMVSILNIVFFWMPFFRVCLPMTTPEPEDGP